ncbi:MAG: sensor domain-containing diguanylate cyclase [Kofleriaceae bacterium]|nr:sensor domain-containing diguanylate cyclase [Kofleriaceae bacterium]MBP9166676.1 sensor domain-containing diguanylate cyclase [Kofleriaceae bacterium]MBP9861462.1 sensor domain-containing diguanylate cyclase [Kofleriaceae bacterium]
MRMRALRRAAAVTWGPAVGIAACAAVALALGPLDLHTTTPGPLDALILAGVLVVLVAAIGRRLRFQPPSARAQRVSRWLAAAPSLVDVELALAVAAGVGAVLAVTGGVTSPVQPLVYGVVAFGLTLLSAPGAAITIVAPLAIEAAWIARADEPRRLLTPVILHVVFVVAAAAAHALFLRGLVASHRRRRALRLARELHAMHERARDYRLIAAALGPTSRSARARDEEERLLAAGGVSLVDDATAWILSTAKRSLGARTVALAWCGDGDRLKLKDVISDWDDLVAAEALPSTGLFGAVMRDRAPVAVVAKRGQLPYYEDAAAADGAAVVAVPVLEGTHLRGVLCADRDDRFADGAVELLTDAAQQIVRAIAAEQVFRAVERAKYEHERFFQAAAMLGRALTPEQVMDTAFDAAGAIVEYDAAVITLYDRDKARHRVAAARLRSGVEPLLDPASLADLEWKDNAGLAAMVVKNRHYLPAGGEPREVTAPIYTRKVKLDGARSLLVLPLVAADEAIGTLMLACRAEKRFGADVREMLSVIATQVAVSLQNGLLYKRMETMATTDGLTGLTNHRTFQERFAQLLDRGARHGHAASLLLCDVDFFKKVNDNYGHPVGDEVLRRVAKVLAEVARKIDVVARYGGEEFAVVLDGSTAEQARAVAERIRQEVGRLVIDTEKGPLSVTMSVGVAAFPEDSRERAVLIERADHALYHAKHSGRNQVVTYAQFVAARAKKAS